MYGPDVRDHFLIHYVVSGKGILSFSDKKYQIKSGDAFIVYPGQTAYYAADNSDPWVYYWVGFNGTETDRLLRLTDFSISSPIINFHPNDKLERDIFDIYKASGNTPSDEARMIGKLYLFLSRLIKTSEKTKNITYSNFDYIEKAVKFIMFNYSRNIDVCDIADYVGISRSHLYRLFIKHLNIPPNEYLSKFRINEACSLLRKSDLSIGEIAFSVGFSDQLYFSRVFKKQKGIAPSAYIRNLSLDDKEQTEQLAENNIQ
ncbi:MAG: AraC family transcriptional regulator [Oscillospiraceae bacterium]